MRDPSASVRGTRCVTTEANKHPLQGTLNPSVLLGHPAQIPPAGRAAEGPRGQTCWGDAARPSAPSIQLGRGRDAGWLRAGPAWEEVTEVRGHVHKRGQHTARGGGRQEGPVCGRETTARRLCREQGRSVSCLLLPRVPGIGSPGAAPHRCLCWRPRAFEGAFLQA